MEDALDRMMAGVASAHEQSPKFIPSKEWMGSKPGYYFGSTQERGLGYHWDQHTITTTHPDSHLEQTATATAAATTTSLRKRARIDTSKNQIKLLSPDELLREAEASVDPHAKIMDLSQKGIQQACISLRKALSKNSLERAQNLDSPENYMDSELALHEQIQAFSSIASTPWLFPILLEEHVLEEFSTILSHENTDIALTVIQMLVEWLDPTLGNSVERLAMHVAHECLELVVANLGRLNPNDEEDRQGMEYILSLVENIMELNVGGVEKTCLVPWLFQHLSEDRPAEVLALVFQQESVYTFYPDLTRLPPFTSSLIEDDGMKAASTMDGMELILQAIAKYRKVQPETEDQVEHLENMCTILASALAFSTQNIPKFQERQGVELVLRCIREKMHSGGVGLQLLDIRDKASCEHLVVAGGLKSLFPLFMGRAIPKPAPCSDAGHGNKKARKEWLLRMEHNLIHIIYNWIRFLDKDSPEDALERLLVKFLENDCEKCDRLVELLLGYDQRTRLAEYKFYRSDIEESLVKEEVELAAMEAKLSGGGDFFHRLGAISAFCCVHSKTCHAHILQQLTLQKSGIGIVKTAVEDFISVLEDGNQKVQLISYLERI